MHVLLTSIGSRGDIQPLLALATELQTLGHQALICAAPNFQQWVESYGVSFMPTGIDLEKWTKSSAASQPPSRPTPEQRQQLARYSVISNFEGLKAAKGADLMVVAGTLQTAGRSIAEALNIPYVFVAYCPTVLPSADHPPAKMDAVYDQALPAEANLALWAQEEASFNDLFRDVINEQRAALNLPPVDHVLRHITTDTPWLATDCLLGPAGIPINMEITQAGTWFLNDPTPLSDELLAFLTAGEPPIYFGFGSMRGSEQTSRLMIEAARALGRRAIILQGWGDLQVLNAGADCIAVNNVNHAKLLPHVAAVVHHGGAGTTAAAARAGKPQVIVPHVYDQHYWAHRMQLLGVGVSPSGVAAMTADSLIEALRTCLQPEIVACAADLATQIDLHGAQTAAEQLIKNYA